MAHLSCRSARVRYGSLRQTSLFVPLTGFLSTESGRPCIPNERLLRPPSVSGSEAVFDSPGTVRLALCRQSLPAVQVHLLCRHSSSNPMSTHFVAFRIVACTVTSSRICAVKKLMLDRELQRAVDKRGCGGPAMPNLKPNAITP